jgi:type IV pilus assembly protein PilA
MRFEISIAITVAFVVTIVNLGIQAYRDYTVRSRVTELVNAASNCKSRVGQFYVTRGRLPSSASEAGCPDNVTPSANPLAVFHGEVIVQAVGALAAQLGRNNQFAFRAICADGACEGAPMEGWSCSASGKAASSTTILPKYLPTSCL